MSFFFFFSSRRRHTRCSRDWSSDVCSSDLIDLEARGSTESPTLRVCGGRGQCASNQERDDADRRTRQGPQRSEERRVGKECRSRGAADQEKKKEEKEEESRGVREYRTEKIG